MFNSLSLLPNNSLVPYSQRVLVALLLYCPFWDVNPIALEDKCMLLFIVFIS